MNKRILAGILTVFAGMTAQAGTIVYEPAPVGGVVVLDAKAAAGDAGDLQVNIIAEILETFKLEVTNPDMDDSTPDFGVIDLGRYNVSASVADAACRVEETPIAPALDPAYFDCAVDAVGQKFDFTVKMDYLVTMSGGFTIDVNLSLQADGAKSLFLGETLSVDGGAAAATALIDDASNASAGQIEWKGSMPFTGSTISQHGTIVDLDVVRNP